MYIVDYYTIAGIMEDRVKGLDSIGGFTEVNPES